MNKQVSHIPVLKTEVLKTFEYLGQSEMPFFVDGTLGAGGHSLAIANNFQLPDSRFQIMGIDQDEEALKIAKSNIKKAGLNKNFILVHDNFKNIKNVLDDANLTTISGALIDLGVSSMQLDDAKRGFSFKDSEQPLDMRMDQSRKFDAKYILANYPEAKIEHILKEYGEEPFARRIAKNIRDHRKIEKIEKIGTLLEIIAKSIPDKFKHGRTHFATKTFQALRIEVNAELRDLDKVINDFVDVLEEKGRLAVISFHSLEDRIVKHTFQSLANPCECPKQMPCICGKKPMIEILTRKPIIPTEKEIEANPRSRSAKLRIVEKL